MEDIVEGILGGEKEGESISSCLSLFPKLDSLELGQLPKVERFCSGVNIPIELPSLRGLKTWNCPVLRTLNCNSTNIDRMITGTISLDQPQHLFNAKVNLPVLEKLDIQNMDNLERLWHSQLAEHSFSKLTSIVLRDCPKLLTIFPLNMLTRLQRLNHLSIWDCKSLEEIIFESQPQEGSSSRAMQSFSLQLIQSGVAFEFPRLASLTLDALPNLRSIHRKMLTINWPSLKEMEVKGCDKVEILFSSQETSGISCQQQPLFWVNQFTFPKLHQLTLGWNVGMKEIWHCVGQQLVSHYFPNLKVVKLEYHTEQILPLPPYLFPLLSSPNLQTLEIGKLFQKMIFISEEGGEEKSPWVRKFNLVPSSASFRNLVTLKVERCHGIVKVITHATSKSLVQLKELNINICNNIL
ncbi:hypothetical protein V6N13_090734 [Hibiscus sabdariffa]|uniref:Disease resistance protein At4g27190-like leucine-rich repeats domain-containing protein n=1 Tax=Hibiscus sabdariffa TaxID=183260 RepID=A0ABR2BNN7_9ROSI